MFKVQVLRAKLVARRCLARAVEILMSIGIRFEDAGRMALIFEAA